MNEAGPIRTLIRPPFTNPSLVPAPVSSICSDRTRTLLMISITQLQQQHNNTLPQAKDNNHHRRYYKPKKGNR